MSEQTVTWESKYTRKLALWRESTNKSKSARRIKRSGPAAFRAKYDHAVVSEPTEENLEKWGQHAHDVRARGMALGEEDALDASYEAMFVILRYEYNDAFWRNLGKDLFSPHDAAFVLDVIAEIGPMYHAMYHSSEDPSPTYFSRKLPTMLAPMRKQFALLKQPEYDEALARARELWDARPDDLALRHHLAYLFSEITEWGEYVAGAWPARYTDEEKAIDYHYKWSAFVYATGASPETLLALNDKLCAPKPEGYDGYYTDWIEDEWVTLFDLIDRHGVEAAEVLADLYVRGMPRTPKQLAPALGLIVHPAITKAFAGKLMQWSKRGITRSYIEVELAHLHDNPQVSLDALLELSEGKTELGQALFDEVVADLLAQLESAKKEAEQADLYIDRADLPKGLALPPWRDPSVKPAKKKRYKPENFAALEQLPYETSFEIPRSPTYGPVHDAAAAKRRRGKDEAELLSNLLQRIKTGWQWDMYSTLEKLSCDSLETFVEKAPADVLCEIYYSTFQSCILDPLGEKALPAVEKYLGRSYYSWSYLSWSIHVGTPSMVPAVSDALATLSTRVKAQSWIQRYPEAAAIGAIPALLKADEAKTRNRFIDVLCVASAHAPEVVQDVIAAYGDEVAAALPELDVYMQYPARMPKLPHLWTPELWTPIRLKSDPSRLLPRELYEDIGLMLKFSPPGSPYVGLMELGEIADETSLANFAWDMFEVWFKDDGPNKEIWMIEALGMFGGARMADELPHLLDRWFDSKFAPRAKKIMYALTNVDNPYVVETFWRLYKGGHNSERSTIRTHIDRISNTTNTIDALADAQAPTFGMNASRTLELVEGADLEVWLDADLEPHLRNKDRSVAELDPTTELRWERLQALCSRQNAFQALRFERAMKIQRRWSAVTWTDTVLEHPLLSLIAQRIVWGTYDSNGKLLASWRIDEGGELIDANDDPYTFPEGAIIGIPHPIEMGTPAARAWTEILSDYEIAQPFDQLSKPSAPIDGDAIEELFERFEGKKTTLGAIKRMCYVNDWKDLYNRKRERDISTLHRDLQNTSGSTVFTVGIDFSPGFRGGTWRMHSVQPLTEVVELRHAEVVKRRKAHSWAKASHVELAELHHDLSVLMAQPTGEE